MIIKMAQAMVAFLGLWLLSGTGPYAHALRCYTDIEATQITRCKESEGFRTCFTKYNDKGQVTGRGCSTKDKVFYKECETHSYGEQVEKMCFCSYFLCNGGVTLRNPPSFLQLIIGATILCVLSSHCQLQFGPVPAIAPAPPQSSFCDNTNHLRTCTTTSAETDYREARSLQQELSISSTRIRLAPAVS